MQLKGLRGSSRNTIATPDQVRQIRREYASGRRGNERAAFYGIKPVTYDKIGARRSHHNVKD